MELLDPLAGSLCHIGQGDRMEIEEKAGNDCYARD